jgi:preprotein translocase subunit SecA
MDWEKLSDRWSKFTEDLGQGLLRLFGSKTRREVQKLAGTISKINQLEAWAKGLSAEQFVEQTRAWRKAVQAGELDLDEILPEAFALVREASRRTLGLRHYDVQLVGGMVLHQGKVAEMATGEGKTLMATLALYLNALSGQPCFLITVNDYLARRDAAWMAPIYEYCGLTVAAIQSPMHPSERLPVYGCDIVYGTNNEFGFDYLRDNMKSRVEEQVQRNLNFAIVDEVDSILIDEARTPLIISGLAELTPDKYAQADQVARQLERDTHFEVKEKERAAHLKEEGIEKAQQILGVASFYEPGQMDWPHYIENALRAHHLYAKDREYVVENGEVVIVDEFTGRKMTGRRWSDGLHQAVEAKEGLSVRQENQTLATITFQNYFRLYKKLAGMTGTAITEAGEFHKIYGLAVIQVPTNLPIARRDDQDIVYRTEREKWNAIVEELKGVHERGQPVLVGTTSVENSEKLSKLLTEAGLPHEVLNAKNHEREAQIVARAGEKGAITVSTNMAGRGTDIKLGGNFEFRLQRALAEAGLEQGDRDRLAEIDAIRERVRADCKRDEAEVLALGGLYVLGSERHESRRIDNQLRGRSGRQGDVGASRFFLSLEDPLMKRFYRDWVSGFMEKLGMTEGVPIESGMVTRAIQRAQRKVEEYNFEIRKNLLEYDEVMDQQRKAIYAARQDVLEGVGLRERVLEMLERATARALEIYRDDGKGLGEWLKRSFGLELEPELLAVTAERGGEPGVVIERVVAAYEEREKQLGAQAMRQVDRYLLLKVIDDKWKDHLHAIDALKAGIGLRGYAQKDPKNEYKAEAFTLFEKLFASIEDEIASLALQVRISNEGGRGSARAREELPEEDSDELAVEAAFDEPAPAAKPAPAAGPARPAGLPASLAFDAARHRQARAGGEPRGGEPGDGKSSKKRGK